MIELYFSHGHGVDVGGDIIDSGTDGVFSSSLLSPWVKVRKKIVIPTVNGTTVVMLLRSNFILLGYRCNTSELVKTYDSVCCFL